jgi:hypothetical protein
MDGRSDYSMFIKAVLGEAAVARAWAPLFGPLNDRDKPSHLAVFAAPTEITLELSMMIMLLMGPGPGGADLKTVLPRMRWAGHGQHVPFKYVVDGHCTARLIVARMSRWLTASCIAKRDHSETFLGMSLRGHPIASYQDPASGSISRIRDIICSWMSRHGPGLPATFWDLPQRPDQSAVVMAAGLWIASVEWLYTDLAELRNDVIAVRETSE